MNQYKVVAAAYGALANGKADLPEAYDVTTTLQTLLDGKDNNGNVPINNGTFGDPAPGSLKHFGAVVDVNGRTSASRARRTRPSTSPDAALPSRRLLGHGVCGGGSIGGISEYDVTRVTDPSDPTMGRPPSS